jgi:hypothetical protein
MKAMIRPRPIFKFGVALAIAGLAIGLALFLAARLLAGYWPGPRALLRMIVNVGRAAADAPAVTAANHGQFTNIVFLHHSTGDNLIAQGALREQFTEAGFAFWDHTYNEQGLRRPDGTPAGYSYSVPADNTDPDGLALIFGQPGAGLPLNTLSGLLQHEVIVLKSCFAPANQIASDAQLSQHKDRYLGMRDAMDRHPDKLFVVATTPPLNPAETNAGEAARAAELARWLASDAFHGGRANIVVFDLYSRLAEGDPAAPDYGMLREEFRDGADSHPNRTANEVIGPQFADFIIDAILRHRAAHHPDAPASSIAV